jgi:hypothetical protein
MVMETLRLTGGFQKTKIDVVRHVRYSMTKILAQCIAIIIDDI